MTADDSQHAGKSSSLPVTCAEVNTRVEAFLNAEPKTDRIRKVQEQSRLSLRILGEALDRYRYVLSRAVAALCSHQSTGTSSFTVLGADG